MQAWRLEPHNGVDPFEKHIRAWVEAQSTNEDSDDEWDIAGPLWASAAKFLLAHINRMCFRVHMQTRKMYRQRTGPPEEKWPTFEQAMAKDHLSPFGACMVAMWLCDSVMPADVRILIGLAERADGQAIVPVVMVMEAGLMIIDPSGLVTGWRPKRLARVKGWVINRAFDVSGSYSLREVIVSNEELTNQRIKR